jgi:hypothetical protein
MGTSFARVSPLSPSLKTRFRLVLKEFVERLEPLRESTAAQLAYSIQDAERKQAGL